MHSEFWWGNLKEEEHLEGLREGRIILKWLRGMMKGIDWFHMVQDRGKWWAPVNTVTNHCNSTGTDSTTVNTTL